MKLAIEGCCHGELDAIYKQVETVESKNKYKIDALLICGDFQAMRNQQDLQCMACPDKYKEMMYFHKYYTGQKRAPLLTIVIGGNHEASNYMQELYHGGWLAPNIYFLGHAGSVLLNGIRITGSSGIFKSNDYHDGQYEKVPYNSRTMRSIYHTREFNIRRLSLLPSTRIFMSHDWPQSIEQFGNTKDLLRRKPHFRQDIERNELGSPPLMSLLRNLKPEWWFSAHMHTRFQATVVHGSRELNADIDVDLTTTGTAENPDEIKIDEDVSTPPSAAMPAPAPNTSMNIQQAPERINPDEIILDNEEETEAPRPAPPVSKTKFLALDKCLPHRNFLEIVNIPTPETITQGEVRLSFDRDWLAIARAFNPWFSTSKSQRSFPTEDQARALVAKEAEWVEQHVKANEDGEIPILEFQSFIRTAPGPENQERGKEPQWYPNPQTRSFCRMLDIPDTINDYMAAATTPWITRKC